MVLVVSPPQMLHLATLPADLHCELNVASLKDVPLKYILMYWIVAGASLVGGPLVQPAPPLDQTFAMIVLPILGTFLVMVYRAKGQHWWTLY